MDCTLHRHKNITDPYCLLGHVFHINIQLLHVTIRTFFMQAAHLQCCHNHLKSIIFRRELQLEAEQMYTTNWIVVTWRRNWGVTWYDGWGNFLLVTTLLSLLSLHLVKVKLKYFWFDTWPLDRSVKWLCWWGPFTLSHHFAKFGIQRPWESEDITCVICHVTMYLKCPVTCGGGASSS